MRTRIRIRMRALAQCSDSDWLNCYLVTGAQFTSVPASKMPATALSVEEDGIYRCNDGSNTSEPVSNFILKLTASVENTDSGFLVLIKRIPHGVEK